jgi:hypothetical protein
MKTMDKFCRVIAVLLLVSFVSCTSTPYEINFNRPQFQIASGFQRRPQQLQLFQYNAAAQQSSTQQTQTAASAYWTGDGGRGKSITILPPRGSGLADNQAYLPDLVANELVSNFNSFSAMTLFDRVNNQRQYDELLSGYYSDDDKAGWDLGHLASTDYMLLGTITRTSTGYALQLTVNRNSDKTTLASYSGTATIAELDNLLGVRRASLDLLKKMGVQLTAQAQTELSRAATVDQVNALTAMAQGITAQRQGTDVAALTYFFQAAAFDASLVEAVSRTNVLSANISTGNIGANVRNDFAWYDDWKAKLTETETLMNDMLRNTSPQRSIWYSNDIVEQESARDPVKRTTELRIEAVLHTHAVFPVSVQRTVQAVYDGLQTTKRAEAWKLNGWPRQGVTNSNPFYRTWGNMIPIVFEVLNEKGQVIGRQTVEMDSRYSFNGTRLEGPGTAFTTVRFTGVRGDDIYYPLSIRIASINGRKPEEAGISRIEPMSATQIASNKSFTIYNGTIQPSSSNRDLGSITIPAELWGERVTDMAFENRNLTSVTISEGITTIGVNAFANSQLSNVIIPSSVTFIGANVFSNKKLSSVTIPSSVTTIGANAFTNNQLKIVIIPSSVTSIGANAFANNQLSSVTIPSSVTTIEESTFANNQLTSVTIPEGVIIIGERAFAGNHWKIEERYYGLSQVIIANSVTSIGNEAFCSHWTTEHRKSDGSSYTIDHWMPNEVTIGANVTIGHNALGRGFDTFYYRKGRLAGFYLIGWWSRMQGKINWERFDSVERYRQSEAKEEQSANNFLKIAGITLLVLLIGGYTLALVMNPDR